MGNRRDVNQMRRKRHEKIEKKIKKSKKNRSTGVYQTRSSYRESKYILKKWNRVTVKASASQGWWSRWMKYLLVCGIINKHVCEHLTCTFLWVVNLLPKSIVHKFIKIGNHCMQGLRNKKVKWEVDILHSLFVARIGWDFVTEKAP